MFLQTGVSARNKDVLKDVEKFKTFLKIQHILQQRIFKNSDHLCIITAAIRSPKQVICSKIAIFNAIHFFFHFVYDFAISRENVCSDRPLIISFVFVH